VRLHFEDGEREVLIARLGLDDDADDAAVAQAVAAWMQENPEPTKKDDKDDDTNASSDVSDLEADEGDVVIVDVSEFKRLRKRDQVAAEVEEATRRRDRDELVEEAIADGKFSPSRREHYKNRYDSDKDGTVKLIGRLTKNTVPLEERGADVPTDEVDQTSYPQDWVPEVAARAAQGKSPNRVHGEN
jgi:hypothetical protein